MKVCVVNATIQPVDYPSKLFMARHNSDRIYGETDPKPWIATPVILVDTKKSIDEIIEPVLNS